MEMTEKILVVDDEEGILCLLQDYFEIQGYEVITARGGVEAIEKVEKLPDIILLDINMPDMSGLEVCRRNSGACELSDRIFDGKSGRTGSNQWIDDGRRWLQ